jgi:hypothetical protein
MSFDYEEAKAATAAAFKDPQPGDRFQEMYSFWMGVVAVLGGNHITYVMQNGHPQAPRNVKVETTSLTEWRKRFAYESGDDFWVLLADRGYDFSRWLEVAS